jgi:hypothetical protein
MISRFRDVEQRRVRRLLELSHVDATLPVEQMDQLSCDISVAGRKAKARI